MKTLKTLFLAALLVVQAGTLFGQKNEYNIIPKPQELKPASGQFTFNGQTRLFLDKGVDTEVIHAFAILAEHLQTAAGFPLSTVATNQSNAIVCKINKQLPKSESYRLQIDKNKITIEASAPAGFFYAAQTIRQLLPAAIESTTKQSHVQWSVPCCKIGDTPRYDYRGMHLDVSRHFSSKEEVMRYIDQLAFLKLNTFHWHLTDDQGWRIEIKKYPKLTTVGGFRNRTLKGNYGDRPRRWNDSIVGGFYTQDEVKEVLAYAKKRYVNVLPEIELPGHAMAALAGYPMYSCSGGPIEVEGLWGVFNDVYCSREETFTFLENILDEVAALFPYPYIHIGGDECPKLRWERCHACQTRMKEEGLKDEHELQAYFVGRIAKYLETKGKRIIGWDEILEGGLLEKDQSATVMSWRGTEGGIAAAQLGHDVVMTPTGYLYLDYSQSKAKNEPISIGNFVPITKVYSFNPTPAELTLEQAKHIKGVQANVWTEYMANPKHREYMIFPRVLALSEIAWLDNNKKDYADFEHRLTALLKHYDVMGINYSKAYLTPEGR
jgi:hexosaminidase